MKNRTLLTILVLSLAGFLLLVGGVVLKIALGVLVESGVIHSRPVLDGALTVVILIGVFCFFIGIIGMAISAGWYYLSYSPRKAFDALMASEYDRLLESGTLTEGKGGLPSECILEGIVDDTPVTITLTHRHAKPMGPFFVHRRTTFFAPFPASSPSPFRVLPTGRKGGSPGDIPGTFARRYSLPSEKEREAFIHSGLDEGVMSAMLTFSENHGGTLSVGHEGVWWAEDRLDFGGEAQDILSEFLSTSRRIADAVAAGPRVITNADEHISSSRPAGPPVYVSMRTLTFLFPILFALGGGSVFLGWVFYPESIPIARFFVVTGLFLLVPGIIGTPLMLIYRMRSKKASRS